MVLVLDPEAKFQVSSDIWWPLESLVTPAAIFLFLFIKSDKQIFKQPRSLCESSSFQRRCK